MIPKRGVGKYWHLEFYILVTGAKGTPNSSCYSAAAKRRPNACKTGHTVFDALSAFLPLFQCDILGKLEKWYCEVAIEPLYQNS